MKFNTFQAQMLLGQEVLHISFNCRVYTGRLLIVGMADAYHYSKVKVISINEKWIFGYDSTSGYLGVEVGIYN